MHAPDRRERATGLLKHTCCAESGADLAARQRLRAVKWRAEAAHTIASDPRVCAGRGMWSTASVGAGESA
jgi:hypothetical protein